MDGIHAFTSWIPASLIGVFTPTLPTTWQRGLVQPILTTVALTVLNESSQQLPGMINTMATGEGGLKTDHWKQVKIPFTDESIPLPPVSFQGTVLPMIANIFYPIQVFFTGRQLISFGTDLATKVSDLKWHFAGSGASADQTLNEARLQAALVSYDNNETAFWTGYGKDIAEGLSAADRSSITAAMLRQWAQNGDTVEGRKAIAQATGGAVSGLKAGQLLKALQALLRDNKDNLFTHYLAQKERYSDDIAIAMKRQGDLTASATQSPDKMVIRNQKNSVLPTLGRSIKGLIQPAIMTTGTLATVAAAQNRGDLLPLAESILKNASMFSSGEDPVNMARGVCEEIAEQSWLSPKGWIGWGYDSINSAASSIGNFIEYGLSFTPHAVIGGLVVYDGVKGGPLEVLRNMPYYLATAAIQDVGSEYTTSLGQSAQSYGLFTSLSASWAGRTLLLLPLLVPLATKVFKGMKEGKTSDEKIIGAINGVIEEADPLLNRVALPTAVSLLGPTVAQFSTAMFSMMFNGLSTTFSIAQRGWDCTILGRIPT